MMARDTNPLTLDEQLVSGQYLQNPYPVHDQLQRDDPVHWCSPWQMWVVTRYQDVRTVLMNDGLKFSAVGQTSAALAHLPPEHHLELESLERIFSAGLLWSDPPDHTRIRALVNKALTPRDAERLKPLLQRVVASLVDQLPINEALDVVQELAEPVPVTVLAALVGIPDTDVSRFRQWATTLAAFLGTPLPDIELARAAQACVLEASDFIAWLKVRRHEDLRDDVVSRLVALEQQGRSLSRDEFTATIIVLLVGGHRTTSALLGNSLLALAQHQNQAQALRQGAVPIAAAVEEFLRFESPHQRTVRIAKENTSIGRQRIDAGQIVALLNGAANRDPTQFEAPGDLRLNRTPNRHLALSAGIHFCIGAPLARLEGAMVLEAMLARFETLDLIDDQVPWLENYTLRTATRLVMRAT